MQGSGPNTPTFNKVLPSFRACTEDQLIIRAQIYTCSFVFLGELNIEMLAVTVTASIFRGINYSSIQFEQVSLPSQEAIQLPVLISGKLI